VPFEAFHQKHIVVVGAGVSGLAAAYRLASTHQVTLLESAPRLGGHARTVMAGVDLDIPVDTGFIVFNYQTYPHLTAMFEELNVPVKESDMSFGVSVDAGRLEYGLKSLQAATAQKSNLANPKYWRMLSDVLRFNANAEALANSPDMTISQFLDRLKVGEWFRNYYLLPMSGAIWSSTPDQIGDFPAQSLVQFFKNHALLTPNTHQWYTVDGGSIEYVRRLEQAILKRGASVVTNAHVEGVRRHPTGVDIRFSDGKIRHFDEVVFACHSDQTLAMLEDATPSERSILGRIKYQRNRAVLHSDESQMPKRKAAWSSWVYKTAKGVTQNRIGITYWMNSLQGIDNSQPMFVSLNPSTPIDENLVYDEAEFMHPVFDVSALRAQQELPKIQGLRNTWFCGAWTRHGFHEDGFASGVMVADLLNSEVLAA
jgi:predicted NAD/FAD-binding protein